MSQLHSAVSDSVITWFMPRNTYNLGAQMKDYKHLRLVEASDERGQRAALSLLNGPPWSWLALVAATVVTPAIQSVNSVLRAYEAEHSQSAAASVDQKLLERSHS